VEDAELLVSELVTNATRASWVMEEQPPIALRLLAHERLLIEVWDRSPQEPVADSTDPSADSGPRPGDRGSAQGQVEFRRVSYGLKAVWCEVVLSRFLG
jgi:anti-sigma regulatory factor (Ser/Thr protein kinase)